MRAIFKTKQLVTPDSDGICVAQTTAGAGNLILNGALVSGGKFTATPSEGQRKIGITSAGNLSSRTFTIYGKNEAGLDIRESLAGPNATTVSTILDFFEVNRVHVDGAVGTAVEVGTTGVGATPPIPLDQYISPFNVSLFIVIASGATVNVTVQYTSDDIFDFSRVTSPTGISWTNHSALTNKTSNSDSNIAFPASAVRMVVNSGTDAATLIIRQAGIF